MELIALGFDTSFVLDESGWVNQGFPLSFASDSRSNEPAIAITVIILLSKGLMQRRRNRHINYATQQTINNSAQVDNNSIRNGKWFWKNVQTAGEWIALNGHWGVNCTIIESKLVAGAGLFKLHFVFDLYTHLCMCMFFFLFICLPYRAMQFRLQLRMYIFSLPCVTWSKIKWLAANQGETEENIIKIK